MEANALHDLTAAYALDALDPDEARAYEAHLAHCERCREELASLSEAATALAYAPEAPTPPPELRARILQQARASARTSCRCARAGSSPSPLSRPSRRAPRSALGIWAAVLSGKLDSRTDGADAAQRRWLRSSPTPTATADLRSPTTAARSSFDSAAKACSS